MVNMYILLPIPCSWPSGIGKVDFVKENFSSEDDDSLETVSNIFNQAFVPPIPPH